MNSKVDVGLLTCLQFPDLQKDYRPLIEEFKKSGLKANPVIWNDKTVDFSNYKNLIFCSAWDYHKDYKKFNQWLSMVENQSNLINAPEIIRWNMDKSYLRRFEAFEIPVIETYWIEKPQDLALKLLNELGDVVIKPAVGAGSSGMKRFKKTDQFAGAQEHINSLLESSRVMVQPYHENADKVGETALLYFDGKLSHAVSRPIAGHMGTPDQEVASASHIEPNETQLAIGNKVIECLPFTPAYLRVDLIEDNQGKDLVLEAEMIEPTLFLEQLPESSSVYVETLKQNHLN